MKRIIALAMVIAMILLCFTGCMYSENHITINEDGTGTLKSRVEIEKSAYDQVLKTMGVMEGDMNLGAMHVETIDGVEYYVEEETMAFESFGALAELLENEGYTGVYVSAEGIRYVFRSESGKEQLDEMEALGVDAKSAVSAKIIITMPQDIVKTTGTLLEDGKSAEFVFDGESAYKIQDIMVSTAKEAEQPSISGVKSKKTYENARTVTVADASGIAKVEYKYKKPDAKAYGKYQEMGLTETFAKNGTYTVRVYDGYGNKATRTFTIKDTAKPTISGAKHKGEYTSARTLKFSDNCKVAGVKLTINGESFKLNASQIHNGVTLSDEGDYKVVVTDVNGNTRTRTFSIGKAEETEE